MINLIDWLKLHPAATLEISYYVGLKKFRVLIITRSENKVHARGFANTIEQAEHFAWADLFHTRAFPEHDFGMTAQQWAFQCQLVSIRNERQ